MTDTAGLDMGSDWKRFMRKHWRTVATFAVAAILAVGSAVYVFLWFVGNAQSTGLVPRTHRSLDNGEPGEFHSERDLLGASPSWNSCCCGGGGSLVGMGETVWRGNETISPLSPALKDDKRWRRSIAVLLYRILHQGLSRWKLECSYR